MIEERAIERIDEVNRLLPGVMRGLMAPPAEGSAMWDLPVPQIRTLHLLRRRGELPMGEIAGCLGVAMSTATQLADRLVSMGLVERHADADDRRVVRLALTTAGVDGLAEQERQHRGRVVAVLGRLTEEEREAVLTGLRLLERAAREAAPVACGRHPLWEAMSAALPADRVGGEGD
jgi:DNA-binding MarR family transcriptional regulator